LIDAVIRGLEPTPLSLRARNQIANRLVFLRHYLTTTQSATYGDQIKGRNFEVPGCGGFLLTGRADNLENYYAPDNEVACFTGVDDLVVQVRRYLQDPDLREAVATAGLRRTVREHTYVHRFTEIFERVGLHTSTDTEAGSVPGHLENVA
jgi:spore maturation protein CgeB